VEHTAVLPDCKTRHVGHERLAHEHVRVRAARRARALAWRHRGDGRYATYQEGLIDLVMRSPEYTLDDATYFTQGKGIEAYRVLENSDLDVRTRGLDFRVPMLIGMGSHDLHTPYALVRQWFDTRRDPSKMFHWFRNSAHSPFLDEPAAFARFLIDVVAPVACAADSR
jgi:pimeloyl-ACP methyl ester carboxylesterase